MNSRPKQPKYARNKNILVIGGSGSGKTRFFVKPNLMQMHSSYVVTDPKGTVLVAVSYTHLDVYKRQGLFCHMRLLSLGAKEGFPVVRKIPLG